MVLNIRESNVCICLYLNIYLYLKIYLSCEYLCYKESDINLPVIILREGKISQKKKVPSMRLESSDQEVSIWHLLNVNNEKCKDAK